MKVEDLVRLPGSWLSVGLDTGTVISSRVRLARNVKDAAFPGWAGKDERGSIYERLAAAIRETGLLDDALYLSMDRLGEVDCLVLKERQLVSNELIGRDDGNGLVVSPDESIAIMINEEDHLRMQAMRPGLSLQAIWERLLAIESALESQVDFSFAPDLGYLTACPTNVGTGMRASVMMHLPALKLTEDINRVTVGLNKMKLAVRGLLGEGTDAWGNMFQVSNQTSLGESEEQIIAYIHKVVEELDRHERNARERLMDDRESLVRDYVGRAYGVLTNAHLLGSKETLDLLSAIRLGIELEFVKKIGIAEINELMILTQPGHLQKIMQQVIEPEARDKVRANLVRERLSGAEF